MDIGQINRTVNRFLTAGLRERISGPEMVQKMRAYRFGSEVTIMEVQSQSTGDGVYNCYKQKLLSAEWDDTAGDDRFADFDTTSVEVLNLAESDTEPDYTTALSAGDLLVSWKFKDDKCKIRWVGMPLSSGTGVTWATITQTIAYGVPGVKIYKGTINGVADCEIKLSGTEGVNATYANIDPREWVPWFCVNDKAAVSKDASDEWRFVQKLIYIGTLGHGSMSWNATDKRGMAVAKGTV